MSAMRWVVSGWLRKYGQSPLSLMREAAWSFSNMPAKPSGAKPACVRMPKPMRSASRSMAREKLSCCWITAACPPTASAAPACGFLLAAIAPSTIAASISGAWRSCWVSMRGMWRWVMWLISCASTEASSSRELTAPTSPVCSPK